MDSGRSALFDAHAMCRGAEIDTALLYENHEDIGKALKSLPRAEAHRK